MLEEDDVVPVKKLDENNLLDFFGSQINKRTSYLLKRGLHRGYTEFNEDMRTIRGKIDFSSSLKRNLINQGKLQCTYDELSYDVLTNQILKSTIGLLLKCEELDKQLHKELALLYLKLGEISDIEIRNKHFRLVQISRNIYSYDLIIRICELIHDNVLISEEDGSTKFRDFIRDERKMRSLFEAFVRNFYRKEQQEYEVRSEIINWLATPYDEESAERLPRMITDTTLQSSLKKIIVETKFTVHTLMTSHRGKSKKIKSKDLYQLFAYISNDDLPADKVEGILLYPTVDAEVDYNYEIHGHKVSVKTINLNQEWRGIHEDMLGFIGVN